MESENFIDTPIFYNNQQTSFFVPKGVNCRYLQIPVSKPIQDIVERYKEAIETPIKSPTLKELINKHYQEDYPVVILVDDHTRPNIHTRAILPLLETNLMDWGVNSQDIQLLIANGTHKIPSLEEIEERILGDLYSHWKERIWLHDCDDVDNHEHLGFSTLGTPILIDRRALKSSLTIPLSDSEYHYFAGIAGSVKLFVPGISARQTVRVNHSRIFDKKTGFKLDCRMGNIENNICIQDIREIMPILLKQYPVFVIDAIMHKGEFIDILAGDPIAIQESALQKLSKIREIPINNKADLVIVSKPSVNFYQAGKGFNAASHAVKPGGSIVLLAECPDGVGPKDYLDVMNHVSTMPSYLTAMEWVIDNKCTETTFEIGIQNAVDLFRILELTKGNLYVYSQLEATLLKEVFQVNPLDTSKSPQNVLRSFIHNFLSTNSNPTIFVFEDFNILTINPLDN